MEAELESVSRVQAPVEIASESLEFGCQIEVDEMLEFIAGMGEAPIRVRVDRVGIVVGIQVMVRVVVVVMARLWLWLGLG